MCGQDLEVPSFFYHTRKEKLLQLSFQSSTETFTWLVRPSADDDRPRDQ